MGLAAAAAHVGEQALLMPAASDIPLEVPEGTPVIADKGHDWRPLRDEVEAEGLVPVRITPHQPLLALPQAPAADCGATGGGG